MSHTEEYLEAMNRLGDEIGRVSPPPRITLGSHLRAWANHCALNVGALLACAWYALWPPRWTGHSRSDIRSLSKGSIFASFIRGIKD